MLLTQRLENVLVSVKRSYAICAIYLRTGENIMQKSGEIEKLVNEPNNAPSPKRQDILGASQ